MFVLLSWSVGDVNTRKRGKLKVWLQQKSWSWIEMSFRGGVLTKVFYLIEMYFIEIDYNFYLCIIYQFNTNKLFKTFPSTYPHPIERTLACGRTGKCFIRFVWSQNH